MKTLSLKAILTIIVATLCATALAIGTISLLSIRSLHKRQRNMAANQLPTIRILGQINAVTVA